MPTFILEDAAQHFGYPLFFAEASMQARRSMCLTRRVGAIVVRPDGIIIGRGANMPPDLNKPEKCNKTIIPKIGGCNDRHCCLHAEQMAILDALANHFMLFDSMLIFVDIDKQNTIIPVAGMPYCTQCAKLAVYEGIHNWICYHAKGVWPSGEGYYLYSAQEYLNLSFAYRERGVRQYEGNVWAAIEAGHLNLHNVESVRALMDLFSQSNGKRVRVTVEEVK